MPKAEFDRWKDRYALAPWGIVADDKRHLDICMLLHQLSNMWAGKSGRKKIVVEDYFLGKIKKEYDRIHRLLYSDIQAPWLDTTVSPEQLAGEGQRLFTQMEKAYGGS